jgi:ubiquinone/menaquinone biosynthesis C-methylase UbiE
VSLKSFIKSHSPAALIRFVRHLKELNRERLLSHRKRALFGDDVVMVPPLRMMHDGPQDYDEFKKNGDEFFNHYKQLCGLQPSSIMLDVGSGIGRKTIPLTKYLTTGRYEGLEIVPDGVTWCRKKISARYPNFNFTLIDVYSKYYNPAGTTQPCQYRFPFEDNSFDVVNLTSVFTHMVIPDVRRYMSEVRRVLKPTGVALISYLLVNEESSALLSAGRGYQLRPWKDGCMVLDPENPEHLIALPEETVRKMYVEAGMKITATYYGSWCDREKFLSYQDLIISQKA